MNITPLAGWLLHRAAKIDMTAPGFAGHVLRSSAERRHTISAYLSVDRSHDGRVEEAAKAAFLMNARHEEIVGAAFGSCPSGFRGALRRAGPEPHPPRFYGYLHALFTSPYRTQTVGLIKAMERVEPQTLAMVRVLPVDVRFPDLVRALAGLRRTRDLVRLVSLLAGHGCDRRAMANALSRVRSLEDVRSFAKRWALKIALPPHPVPSSNSYRPVERSDDLAKLALSYRNCMRNYVSNVMESRSAFAEFVTTKGRAIVHLVSVDGEWLLDRVYGPGNSRPHPALTADARHHLLQHGVRQRQRRQDAEGKWEPLRRLAGHFEFNVDD